MSDWKVPRNVMDQSDLLLHRSAAARDGEPAADVDVKHLNGRPVAEHEVDPVLAARLAERQAAADGILAGLIKKPPKL